MQRWGTFGWLSMLIATLFVAGGANTPQAAMQHFAKLIDWPPHLESKYPDPENQAQAALADYFCWSKGRWGVAEYFSQCGEQEIPLWVREACITLMNACAATPPVAPCMRILSVTVETETPVSSRPMRM